MAPQQGKETTDVEVDAPIYGEGFAAVYTTNRYAVYSQWLAKLALSVIGRHGAPGQQLLDLACGAAAGTVLLAKAGYEVTAVDASAVMIRHAEARAREKGVMLRLYQQDMRELQLPYRVDVVTCLFDALNYLIDESDLACVFERVAEVLRPEGLFVFDMNTPHGLSTRWGTKDIVSTARPEVFEVNQNRFDPASTINTTVTTVFVRQDEQGLYRRYTETHRERGYPTETLVTLLEQAGFSIASLDGVSDIYQGVTHGLAPLSDDVGRMVVAARRNSAT